jgi:two-component system phosphate regulon sensor histidine kinase PhoR
MPAVVSRIVARTLASLAASAVAGAVAGLLAGAAAGWAVAAACICVILLYHLWHLAALARWVANPVPGKVPEGMGTWDDVLTALHRHERDGMRREQLLAESLLRFRRATQALPDGVVILDAENRIEWCNDTAAAQLGLDARADAGQAIANLIRAPAFVEYLAAADPTKAPAIKVQLGIGGVLALQLIPYGDSQKLLLARDVTQAERLETMRRDFVANVSHELRTPLTVLVGFLETVRELKLDPQRTRDYLGMMQEQAARMHRIIEDLLTLSVLESAPPLTGERVRVKPLLERLRSDAEALSAGRHVISLHAAPEVDILGSEAELSSAFGNLVTNAVRYTPQGGEIRLVWRDGSDGASFAVEDTGIGVAPEHIPRLTERFYRVDRGRSRETGGTGLGLAIVKHAVARHQASLDVDSKQGSGSRFAIRFPASRTVRVENLISGH